MNILSHNVFFQILERVSKKSDIVDYQSFKTRFGGRVAWLMKEELVTQSITFLTNSIGLFSPSSPNHNAVLNK